MIPFRVLRNLTQSREDAKVRKGYSLKRGSVCELSSDVWVAGGRASSEPPAVRNTGGSLRSSDSHPTEEFSNQLLNWMTCSFSLRTIRMTLS